MLQSTYTPNLRVANLRVEPAPALDTVFAGDAFADGQAHD